MKIIVNLEIGVLMRKETFYAWKGVNEMCMTVISLI